MIASSEDRTTKASAGINTDIHAESMQRSEGKRSARVVVFGLVVTPCPEPIWLAFVTADGLAGVRMMRTRK
jgi:hypothetical protein